MIFAAQAFSLIVSTSVLITPSGYDDTQEALKACAQLSNNVSRLACYDSLLRTDTAKSLESPKSKFGLKKTPSKLKSTLKTPTAPVMVQNPLTNPRDEAEPSTMKKILNSLTKEKKDITSAAYEVSSHKKGLNGAYIFTMKDRSVWKQTDSMRRPLKKGGFPATISKGTFGSYILKPKKGSWSVRVKRIK